MQVKFFVTGTDTDCGKTYVSVQLLKAFREKGLSTLGIKPIGCGGNGDIEALSDESSVKLSHEKTNPFLFEAPVAPHIAGELSVEQVMDKLSDALNTPSDIKIIEGAGGWLVPLNQDETMVDLVKQLECPVILVVGMKLGCLNHAFLTAKDIQASGVTLAGWIANCIDPDMAMREENITTLQKSLNAPYLGRVLHNGGITGGKFADLVGRDL